MEPQADIAARKRAKLDANRAAAQGDTQAIIVPAELLEEVASTAPAKAKRRSGVEGRTKADTPGLAHRLPRETGCLIAPVGDGMTILERAIASLDGRAVSTRQGFTLDGKPCNTRDVLLAAGVTHYRDGSPV